MGRLPRTLFGRRSDLANYLVGFFATIMLPEFSGTIVAALWCHHAVYAMVTLCIEGWYAAVSGHAIAFALFHHMMSACSTASATDDPATR